MRRMIDSKKAQILNEFTKEDGYIITESNFSTEGDLHASGDLEIEGYTNLQASLTAPEAEIGDVVVTGQLDLANSPSSTLGPVITNRIQSTVSSYFDRETETLDAADMEDLWDDYEGCYLIDLDLGSNHKLWQFSGFDELEHSGTVKFRVNSLAMINYAMLSGILEPNSLSCNQGYIDFDVTDLARWGGLLQIYVDYGWNMFISINQDI